GALVQPVGLGAVGGERAPVCGVPRGDRVGGGLVGAGVHLHGGGAGIRGRRGGPVRGRVDHTEGARGRGGGKGRLEGGGGAGGRGWVRRWLRDWLHERRRLGRVVIVPERASGPVQEKLWEMACETAGAAVLIHQMEGEQGFAPRASGGTSCTVIDFEG